MLSGRKARLARAEAYKEAVRQKLWEQGAGYWYRKLWRKLLAKLFPKKKKQYTDHIGEWYKHTLKAWSKDVYAAIRDPDVQAFARARRKLNRRYAREKAAIQTGGR